MKVLVGVVAIAACSVPDIDLSQKSCPCIDGYVCNGGRCQRMLVDGGPDGTFLSCLGTSPTSSATAMYTFDSSLGLNVGSGSWMATGGEAEQSDPLNELAWLYSSTSTDVQRIVATMHAPSGGTALGIAFRINGPSPPKKQYQCLWNPGTGTLAMQSIGMNGNTTPLATHSVSVSASANVTMEVIANGTNFSCCLDGVASSLFTASDGQYSTGAIGLVTIHSPGYFDNVSVYPN